MGSLFLKSFLLLFLDLSQPLDREDQPHPIILVCLSAPVERFASFNRSACIA